MAVRRLPERLEGKDRPPTLISPSILSSDFARLAEECHRMLQLGADWLHVDVMDGHFVPNLTLGPPIVKSLRKHTDAYLDCHLMVSQPQQWIKAFAEAGANMFTFHLEALVPEPTSTAHPVRAVVEVIEQVHGAGMHAGLALKPSTPVECVTAYVEQAGLDMVLVMSVDPGFGGQQFKAETMDKVRVLRQNFPDMQIQVDGGLAPSTIGAAAGAGANVIVAGSAIFGASQPGDVIKQLRDGVDAAAQQSSAAS